MKYWKHKSSNAILVTNDNLTKYCMDINSNKPIWHKFGKMTKYTINNWWYEITKEEAFIELI